MSAEKKADVTTAEAGWAWPMNSRKAHYYFNGRALCMRSLYFGEVAPGNDDSPDNCMECRRRLVRSRTPAKPSA